MSAERIRSLIGGRVWSNYFKFCFERNPWDKAVSLYFWRTRGQEPRPSLLSFLRTISAYSLSNFDIYSIGGNIAVDHVCLYEDLKSEVEDIRALLHLLPGVELPWTNASWRVDTRHYSEIMGEEEEGIVARVLRQRDIALRLQVLGATLIIYGKDDLIPIGVIREIAGAIPGSRLVELDGCGHFSISSSLMLYAQSSMSSSADHSENRCAQFKSR